MQDSVNRPCYVLGYNGQYLCSCDFLVGTKMYQLVSIRQLKVDG